MNKNEFINILKNELNIDEKTINKIFNKSKELIIDILLKGDKLNINGFGKFYIKEHSYKKYYNLYLDKIDVLEPKRYVSFKSSKKLI